MIKKINILLIVSVAVLFGLKLLLDAVDGMKKTSTVSADMANREVSDLAPTVYFYQWRPYSCVDPITNRNGLFLDIIRAIFPKAKFVCRGDDISDYVQFLDEDPTAVCVNYGEHPYLSKHPTAKTPIGSHRLLLYLPRTSKWRYAGPESLDKLRIGVEDDDLDSKCIRELRKKWKDDPKHIRVVAGHDSEEQACLLAERGEIDAFVTNNEDILQVQHHTARRMVQGFRTSEPIDQVDVLFRVSGKNPELAKRMIDAFDNGMKTIRRTGELKRILEYYNSSK